MHGNVRCWLWVAKGDASAEDDLFLQLRDEPRPVAVFFLRVASFLSWKRTPAPSEQRRAAASIDADDFSFLNGISRNLMTAPSRTCACRRQHHAPPHNPSLSKRKVAFRAATTTAFHLLRRRFYPNNVLLELNSWRLIASCAKTAGGNPMTGPRYSSVVCHIHDGGWSGEAVARRPRLSLPSPPERVQNRTVETHAADACSERIVEQIVEVLGRCSNNLELACSTEEKYSSPTGQFLFVV